MIHRTSGDLFGVQSADPAMSERLIIDNPDLEVIDGNKSRWSHADHRRHGFHNLHRIARYGISFRAAQVLTLEKRMDLRIAELDSVRCLTSTPWFSAMIVIRGSTFSLSATLRTSAGSSPQYPVDH